MNILVLNCGSSSVKFQLFNMDHEEVLASGLIEKIGTASTILRYKPAGKNEIKEVQEILNHDRALDVVLNILLHSKLGVIKDKKDIDGIGHRLVHGGERFSGSVYITDEVIKGITECIEFAPLHNPHNLKGIEVCQRLLPDTPQAGVFDTAFHHKMPAKSYIYGLPYALYTKLGIRRYGFHGTSHYYVSQKAAGILKKPISELKIITCHLGNGCSMAAIKNGVSIDTTMGFTPLEGLIMGTRCGDIDPALVLHIMEKERLNLNEMSDLMNKYSGLKGISETTNDMREIQEEADAGSERHKLALEIFCHKVKKYIGAYSAEMGGVDAIVFTGGIGENSALVRKFSTEGLEFMGTQIDDEKNSRNETAISTGRVAVLVIPTNEELVIARETVKVIEKLREKELEAEVSELGRDEKAELVLIWAKNSKSTAKDIARILSQRISREVEEEIVRKELTTLGLGVR